MSGEVNVNDEGVLIPLQDLSATSPAASDHGRLYNHDGSSSIPLVGGGTTSNKGLYWWDNNAAAWNPLKLTVTDADRLDGYDSTHFAVTGHTHGTGDLTFDPATQSELNGLGLDDLANKDLAGSDFIDGAQVIYDASTGKLTEAVTPSTGKAVPLSITHANWDSGLSSEEIHRINVPSGQSLEVRALDFQMKGGGSSSNLSIDVYDSTNATVIASTTAGGTAATGNPIESSGDGATVLVRLSNSTGSTQKASISGSFYLI